MNCPFHDDKTPSLQVYYKTHTAYCFSSNCKTHGKSLDVIDFIMHKESCSKHEAILKAVEMLNGVKSRTAASGINGNGNSTKANSPTPVPPNHPDYKKGDAQNARQTRSLPGFGNTKFEVYNPKTGGVTTYDGDNKAKIRNK